AMEFGAERRRGGRTEGPGPDGSSVRAATRVGPGAYGARGRDRHLQLGLAAHEPGSRLSIAVHPQGVRRGRPNGHERVRGRDEDEAVDRVAICRELRADAATLPAHAHIQVSPGLGLEAGVPDFVACLSQMRAVREQLEQGRGPPGAAHIGRECGRADSVAVYYV